jgi:TetR/AcrR family transcriptional regulator, transcriptional repressor for nem operon
VRCTQATKEAFTDGALTIIDEISARLAPDDPQSVRAQVIAAFALMIGTLQLARALADQQLADDILEQGVQNTFALLPAEDRS